MKGELYLPGQPIKREDLNYAKYSLQDSTLERLSDLYNYGVIWGSQQNGEGRAFEVASPGGLFINIGSGKAVAGGEVDSSDATKTGGEHVHIPAADTISGKNYQRNPGSGPGSGTGTGPFKESADGLGGWAPTPESTLTRLIPITDNATNYVWVGYLHTVDSSVFSLHKITSGKLYPRGTDGYDILVTTSPSTPVFNGNANYILMATVVAASGSVTSIVHNDLNYAMTKSHRVGVTINTSTPPSTYADGENKFLDAHINAMGTGVLSVGNPHKMSSADIGLVFEDIDLVSHRKNHHSKGLIGTPGIGATSLTPRTDNATPDPSPAVAMVFMKQLSSGEEIVINGQRFTSVGVAPTSKLIAPIGSGATGDAFISFSTTDAAGTWNIYAAVSGSDVIVGKTQSSLGPNQYFVATVYWTGTVFTVPGGVPNVTTDERLFGLTGSKDIQSGAVTLEKMGALSVGTPQLVGASVTAAKMAVDSVPSAAIQAGAITAVKMATDSVSTSAVQNASITAAKLAIGAIPPQSPAIRFYIQGDLAVNNPPPGGPGAEDPRCIAAIMVEKDMSIVRIHMQVDHAPAGGPIIMNLRYLGPSDTRPQWNAGVLFPFTPPTIQAGNTRNGGALLYEDSTNNTDIANVITLQAGGRLYLDITSVGTTTPGGDDCLITIVGT